MYFYTLSLGFFLSGACKAHWPCCLDLSHYSADWSLSTLWYDEGLVPFLNVTHKALKWVPQILNQEKKFKTDDYSLDHEQISDPLDLDMGDVQFPDFESFPNNSLFDDFKDIEFEPFNFHENKVY